MDGFLSTALVLFCITTSYVVAHIFIDSIYRITPAYLSYLIITRQLGHFIEKRRLVNGDLVFIKYRGKYRKAFITCVSHYENQVQAQFFDRDLNIDLVKSNWYPLSRIMLPDYMSRAARVLYSDLED
jgi:hypothetical protein